MGKVENRFFYSKTLAGLLIVSLIAPPMTVFAQTTPNSEGEEVSEAAATSGLFNTLESAEEKPLETEQSAIASPATETSSPETAGFSIETPGSQTMTTMSTGSDVIDHAFGFSYESTKATVDVLSGALTQQIPLEIPPGRKGVEPRLALQYNSQNTENGTVGYGWTVPIPYITRVNKEGTEDLYSATSTHYFSSSMDGELVLGTTTDSAYYPRTVTEQSFEYYFEDNVWTVYDKNGTRYSFGITTDSWLYDGSTTSPKIYRWMLEEVRDTSDNYIKFSYAREDGQLYPTTITYTGHDSTDGPMSITFSREARPDPVLSYATGFKVETKKRISQIEASIDGQWVRRYTLTYTTGNNGYRSLLASVQQTGRDGLGNSQSLDPYVFEYKNDTGNFLVQADKLQGKKYAQIDTDVTGNGLNDSILNYQHYFAGGLNGQENLYTRQNGVLQKQSLNTLPPGGHWAFQDGASDTGPVENGVRILDVTMDGKADIVRGIGDDKVLLRNIYDASSPNTLVWATSTVVSTTIPEFANNGTTGLLGDVNGDGLPDYVSAHASVGDKVYFGNGLGWEEPRTDAFSPVEHMISPTYTTITDSHLIDINGDGLDDWVYTDADSSFDTHVHLNTGSGWSATAASSYELPFSTLYKTSAFGTTRYYDRGMRFLDINGDGLVDFVRSYNTDTNHQSGSGEPVPELGEHKLVLLNTGVGWATSTAYSLARITEFDCGTYSWCSYNFNVYYNEYSNLRGNGQQYQDVLTSITYPLGGSTVVDYSLTTNNTSDNPELPIAFLTVGTTTVSDNLDGDFVTTYKYEGGKIYIDDGQHERKFAGFATVTEKNPTTTTKSYFHQGDGVTNNGETEDSFYLIGKKYREDVLDVASTTLYKKTWYDWDVSRSSVNALVVVENQLVQDFDGTTEHRDIGTGYEYNILQSTTTISLGTSTPTLWLLVVGGGGSGGGSYDPSYDMAGGGGGAGGVVENFAQMLNVGTYSITVGEGATGVQIRNHGINGGDSSVGSEVVAYGGGGGGSQYGTGQDGGSGGGGGSCVNAWEVCIPIIEPGSGVSGQGNDGTAGSTGGWPGHPGGHGGGASSSDGTGSDSIITGATTTYAVGGAGGSFAYSVGASGTGYGAGGGGADAQGSNSAAGADGVVIIRFLADDITVLDRTGSIQTAVGSSTVLTWEDDGAFSFEFTNFENMPEYVAGVNLATTTEYGEVAGSSGGLFTDIGSDKRVTITTYATSSATHVTAPSGVTLYDASSTVAYESKYYYDGLSFGQVSEGLKTRTEQRISGSDYASTTKTYNSYGLVSSETDANGNSTVYTYDAKNLYPATSTNALSQATGRYYDYATGAVIREVDPNGRIAAHTFDPLGRVVEVEQSDAITPSTLVTTTEISYSFSTSTPSQIHETNYLNVASTTSAYTYLDGLGRTVQKRAEAEGLNTYSVSNIYYSNGRISAQALPVHASSTVFSTGRSVASALKTYLYYDPQGRVGTTTTVVGSTVVRYGGWTATTTDPLGNTKALTYDAFGNLVQVTENNGSSAYITQYTYDTNGNLTKITDALGNVRNFTYDNLGRRLIAEDLHAAADGTYGSWSYSYDDVGNMLSYTDAKNQTVDYTYDDLNRPLTENYTGAGGTEVEYAYDSCTYGVGQLCTATSTGAVSTYAYDPLGRTTTETKAINGTDYVTAYTYDRQGNQTGITYSDNSESVYTYNNAGLLESASYRDDGGSWIPVVSNFDYAPTGRVTLKEFGNGTKTTYTYDADELYRLKNIQTILISGPEEGEGGGGSMAFAPSGEKFVLAESTPLALYGALALADSLTEEAGEEATPTKQITVTIEKGENTTEAAVLGEENAEEIAVSVSTTTVSTEISTEVASSSEAELATATTTEESATTTEQISEDLEFATTTSATSSPSVATTTEVALHDKQEDSPGGIRALLVGKSVGERANIKGREIAKNGEIARTSRADYDIQIVSLEVIDGGVQAFVRAWRKDGTQIGFGRDGSVDMERFRIFNPPILVPDEKGDITKEWIDESTGKVYTVTYREDSKEALLQVIEDAIDIKKEKSGPENIQKDKKGNTTSIFYPSVDGMFQDLDTTWSAARNGSGYNYSDSAYGQATNSSYEYWSYYKYVIMRSVYIFNTSPLVGEDLSSATFSLYQFAPQAQADGTYIGIVAATTSSDVALSTADYAINNFGSTIFSQRSLASGVGDFSLNQTGINYINQTGITKLGMRLGLDIENTQPTGVNSISVYYSEQSGTTNDPKLTIEHNSAATAPSGLQVNGETNPQGVATTTPSFSAIFNDPNSDDVATSYRIQVATSSDFAIPTIHWDSTKTALSTTTSEGERSEDIAYTGSALSENLTYYWRIKFWDSADTEGDWSTATSTFLIDIPEEYSILQDIVYTYDAVGNITNADVSLNGSATTTTVYTYDDLYRLTSASTTAGSANPYFYEYSYNAIGNIGSSTPNGVYLYSDSGYSNPHAATTIAGNTLTYDNSGNLTSYLDTTYTWDYKNRMTSAVTTTTSTYQYDHTTARVQMFDGTATTTYPTRYFSLLGTLNGTSTVATSTKYLFGPGGELVASILSLLNATTTASATSTVSYTHPDHLGSTSLITDSYASSTQTTLYYPYGATQAQTGSSGLTRGYIGEVYDESSGLNYLNNRYLQSSRGQFLSQDPTFLAIGSPQLSEILTRASGLSHSSFRSGSVGAKIAQERDRRIQQEFLSDPQLLNSYSYARNNPIRYSDPTGEVIPLLPILGIYSAAQTLINLYEAKTVFWDYPEMFSSEEKYQTGFKVGLDAVFRGTTAAAKTVGEKIVLQVGPTILDVLDHYFGRQVYQNVNQQQIQSQNTVQGRQQIVQSYNSSFGLSTGGGGSAPSNNSLWVTPNGAVVNFGGQLVAPAPK